MTNKKKLSFNFFTIAATILITTAISIIAVFIYYTYSAGYQITGDLGKDPTNAAGTFIAGTAGTLFSLAGVLLFYHALMLQRKDIKTNLEILKNQKKELELQRKELELTREVLKDQQVALTNQASTLSLQQFESTLFNMINNHLKLKMSIMSDSTYDYNNFTLLIHGLECDHIDPSKSASIDVLQKTFSKWGVYFNMFITSLEYILSVQQELDKIFYFKLLLNSLDVHEPECLMYYSVISPTTKKVLEQSNIEFLLKENHINDLLEGFLSESGINYKLVKN